MSAATAIYQLTTGTLPVAASAITSPDGTIDTLTSTTGTIETLNSTTGTIVTLNSTTANISTLSLLNAAGASVALPALPSVDGSYRLAVAAGVYTWVTP